MDINELKPCPFCGGKVRTTIYSGETATVYYIECEGCKALMGNPRPLRSALRGKLYFDNLSELVDAWNKRKE